MNQNKIYVPNWKIDWVKNYKTNLTRYSIPEQNNTDQI